MLLLVALIATFYTTNTLANSCSGKDTKCVPEAHCTRSFGLVEEVGTCESANLVCCFVGGRFEARRKRQILGGLLGGNNNGGNNGGNGGDQDLGDLLNKGGMLAGALGDLGVIDKETADKVQAGAKAGMLIDMVSKDGINKDNFGEVVMKGGEIVMDFKNAGNDNNGNTGGNTGGTGNSPNDPCSLRGLTPYYNSDGSLSQDTCVNNNNKLTDLNGTPLPENLQPGGSQEPCALLGFTPRVLDGEIVPGQCVDGSDGSLKDTQGNPIRDNGLPMSAQPSQTTTTTLVQHNEGSNGDLVLGANGEQQIQREAGTINDGQVADSKDGDDKDSEGGLDTVAWIGIGVVGFLFLMLLCALAFCLVTRHRQENMEMQVNVHNPAFGQPQTLHPQQTMNNAAWGAPAAMQPTYSTNTMSSNVPPRAYGAEGPPRPEFTPQAAYGTQMTPQQQPSQFETAMGLPDVNQPLRADTGNAQYGLSASSNTYNQQYGEGPFKCPYASSGCPKSYFSQEDCDQHVSLRHGL